MQSVILILDMNSLKLIKFNLPQTYVYCRSIIVFATICHVDHYSIWKFPNLVKSLTVLKTYNLLSSKVRINKKKNFFLLIR
jgi:hypothetical protein